MFRARSAALVVILLALAGCASTARPAEHDPSEVLVRVTNASGVPLRVRLCGDPCTEYTAASAGASIDFRLDVSRQRRFVITAMEGDRRVAQEPFIAYESVLELTIQPPRIERLTGRASRSD